MSDDDLETRLTWLPQDAPRADLRADVLDRVRAELRVTEEGVSLLDRWLARPAAWIAAAVLLVGLLVGQGFLERGLERTLRGSPAEGNAPRPQEEAPTSSRQGVLAFSENQAMLRRLVAWNPSDV